MRVRPKIYDHGQALIERKITPKHGKIEPFLASGGINYFLTPPWPSGNEVERGAQFIVGVYIPKGYVGFLKQLRVAPYMPSVLVPKFMLYDGADYYAFWTGHNEAAYGGGPIRPDGQTGVWETPFGWESYFNVDSEGPLSIPPRWNWTLKIINGDIQELRRSHTNFDSPNFSDLSSWYLWPDFAVPIEVYASGLPGTTPGIDFANQRMQVLQSDQLSMHVVIPEDSTLALFAEWEQYEFRPSLEYSSTDRAYYYDELVYPLLPSFGSLLGYMQTISDAAAENMQHGWGG